jgi:hypothetical protein
MDDYYNESGTYLGTDDAKTQQVRIMQQQIFDLNKEELVGADGIMDASLASALGMSALHSECNIGAEASLAVYQHYNPTDLSVFDVSNSGSFIAGTTGMAFTWHLSTGKIEGIGIDIEGLKNAKISDNVSEIKSLFTHEAKHYSDFKDWGLNVYNDYKFKNNNLSEQRAISAQMKDPTFIQTRQGFQQSIIEYANKNGMLFPLKPNALPLINIK